MKTTILPIDHPEAVMRALALLKKGKLVAFPTDTVYGLGASAFNGQAIEEIYIAKSRPVEKSIPILIGEKQDLEQVAVEIPELARKLADRFWPGPLTLVVPKRADLPRQVSSTAAVGVRMPDHPFALNLLHRAGPMAVSSANLSGQDSPTTAEEVMDQLSGRISLILDGGRTPGGIPSTVVDCLGAEVAILREGPISRDQILAGK
jgi:L-threonylcarbamoyladenylate synthase